MGRRIRRKSPKAQETYFISLNNLCDVCAKQRGRGNQHDCISPSIQHHVQHLANPSIQHARSDASLLALTVSAPGNLLLNTTYDDSMDTTQTVVACPFPSLLPVGTLPCTVKIITWVICSWDTWQTPMSAPACQTLLLEVAPMSSVSTSSLSSSALVSKLLRARALIERNHYINTGRKRSCAIDSVGCGWELI